MAIAIIVDWYGPYSTVQALRGDMRCWSSGVKALYMGVKSSNIVNYVGLTSSPATRMNNHAKLGHDDNKKFFCGEIVSQGVGGRRRTKCKTDLKLAEHALIAWLQPPQNSALKMRDLEDCIVLYSRFFDDDDSVINPLPEFPKVIAYNSWNERWDA